MTGKFEFPKGCVVTHESGGQSFATTFSDAVTVEFIEADAFFGRRGTLIVREDGKVVGLFAGEHITSIYETT